MTSDDLKKFCADESDIRPSLQKPWTRDGFTWATNGHIMVRVPAMDDVPENPAAPNAMAIWEMTPAPKEWLPVPVVTKSFAKVEEECGRCYGNGQCECDYGHIHDCGECNGKGIVMGDLKHTAVPVGDGHFADYYLSIIQGWEIAPSGPSTSAWIRNGEVIGLLMPMRAK